MWSDNDIDKAFRRLDPPEPEPVPFPLDGWLRLETELDKAVIERAVRRRLWKFFAAEIVVVILAFLGWLAWPTAPSRSAAARRQPAPATVAAVAPARGHLPGPGTPLHRPAPAGAAALTTEPPAATTTARPATPAPLAAPAATAAAASPAGVAAARHHPGFTAGGSNVRGGKWISDRKRTIASPLAKRPATTNDNPSLAGAAWAAGRSGRRRTQRPAPADARPVSQGEAASRAFRAFSLAGNHPLTGPAPRAARSSAEAGAADSRGEVAGRPSGPAARAQSAGAYPLATPTTAGENEQPAAGSRALLLPDSGDDSAVVAAGAVRRGHPSPLLGPAAGQPKMLATGEAPAAADAESEAPAAAVAALLPRRPHLSPTVVALPAPLAPLAVVPANLPAPERQPRFYLGLVAAPDLSTVKFVNVERPRLNLGVIVEYRLTNRLRVGSGLLRVSKQYLARREDYDWSAYPRAATRDFTWIDGSCTVLDIPLNLRYDALVRPQARLFGSVGLSSFFMQRERYQYDYTEYNTTYVWDRTFINESQHLFKILNLSFGYERRLGSHWSLQAEPYLKLPLAGVGVGKLSLSSGGVFFGVKYGF